MKNDQIVDPSFKVPEETQRSVFITTIDNPYDYFEDFDHWFLYDTEMGYNTCARIDRIASTSLEESSYDYTKEIERAVDQLCKWNLNGLYKKIEKVHPIVV